MQTLSQNTAEATPSVAPSFTLSAENKFASQVLRLYADLNLAHSDNDAADYIEMNELATAMEEWHRTNSQSNVG